MSPLNLIERTQIDFAPDRFSTAPRELAVSGKPAAPPPDPPAKQVRIYEPPPKVIRVRANTSWTRTVKAPKAPAEPKPPKPPKQSIVATSPCVADGGPHVWGPHSKKQAVCRKCDRKVFKRLIPGLVLVRRNRAAATEFTAPCTNPKGHRAIKDGKFKGIQRMKCANCGRTRNAGPLELAGTSECHLHPIGLCTCPAYLIAMGANDRQLEADIEAGESA